jgi:hypothetical protein
MTPSEVYDIYWYFAAERQAIYDRRLEDPYGPWTDDPILKAHRFTNTYRAADRVSQYLIREVQYRPDRPDSPTEIFFRTLLFKLFNKIETWTLIEGALGPVTWQSFDATATCRLLDEALAQGRRVYSAAYIMPPPALGHVRKHANHIALLEMMMRDGLPARVANSVSLREVYDLILPYPGIGPFLAYQYAIDLNYSDMLDFSEDEFVVAGPGALDGIAKCFNDAGGRSAADIIHSAACLDVGFSRSIVRTSSARSRNTLESATPTFAGSMIGRGSNRCLAPNSRGVRRRCSRADGACIRQRRPRT